MKFSIIAAVDINYGIGKNNRLPWRLPSDLKYFSEVTTGAGRNAVIMGRRTWESLPKARRPLTHRLNIVLTRDEKLSLPEGVFSVSSLDEALAQAEEKNAEEIFIIGGAAVFSEAIKHPACEKIYLTQIDAAFTCDTFFPRFDTKIFKKTSGTEAQTENDLAFHFNCYQRSSMSISSQ